MKRIAAAIIAILLLLCTGCQSDPPAPGAPQTSTPATTSSEPSGGTILRGDETDPPETTSPDEDPVSPETRLSFVACGDNIVYYGNVREALEIGGDGGMDFRYSYERIRDTVQQADIAFINQENIMTRRYPLSYYPCFNVPVEVGEAVIDTGFDIVNLANNHMLDKSELGLRDAIAYWRNSGLFTVGDYLSEEEYNTVRVYEKDGVRIAFLSYTYGTNGLKLPASSDVVVPYLFTDEVNDIPNEATLRRQVAAAKEAADLVFVSVHWGWENTMRPTAGQRNCAQLFADLGVDAVIGHHPHVIQPIEWLEGAGGNRTLCVYSLGNLMAEMASDYNMVGGILSFDIVKDSDGSYLENVLFRPTVFYFTKSFRQNIIYDMEDFTTELAASHGIAYYGNRMTLERLRSYVTDTIDREFLPSYLF